MKCIEIEKWELYLMDTQQIGLKCWVEFRREPRDAAAVVFGLKFADNIHYKFKSSQASKARLQSSKRTGVKQHLTQNGHFRSRVLE